MAEKTCQVPRPTIKNHNDKLHKEQDKVKAAKVLRKEKLKLIVKKFNENNASEDSK